MTDKEKFEFILKYEDKLAKELGPNLTESFKRIKTRVNDLRKHDIRLINTIYDVLSQNPGVLH